MRHRAMAWVLLAALGAAATAVSATANEDETAMARAVTIPLQRGLALAVAASPGRVAWASRERTDAGLVIMVEVVGEDRRHTLVTLDAGTGKVVATAPMTPKPKPAEPDPAPPRKPRGSLATRGVAPGEYAFLARISMDQAIRAATAKHPGRLVEVYLYAEDGALLYGIEVSPKPGLVTLVKVDAGNGKLLGKTKG